ncbi:hypothetical protein HS1genome_1440 [Sulfodiicoccus acidiphilus]|uniref:4Fe-4S ferredoxin-type domain-containing protein n=1 Tax=Sulfodiicoccus acidiphilus TaxID=1670455 RepID=A0A348B4E9_9CREN|nr:FAD-binding protein [Sulfodiicoccus acidiphilus]BBD73051.1 hypothetical protein HS1genome_1440 [Sulfodiicoccus acidiphilus]GGU03902.1 hypothetical protein GCM10007116_20880 [Sulfodiicoccus acidiphilus]
MILDASVFSRALPWVDQRVLDKFQDNTKEVVFGRGTSMRGDALKHLRAKAVGAARSLPGGKVVEVTKESSLEGSVEHLKVAAGATYDEVLEAAKSLGLAPALIPLFGKGTVGGFVSTNGSGLGSYKYGFVNYSRRLGTLLDRDTAVIGAVPYLRLLEVDSEVEFAWSAISLEGEWRYYLPERYAEVLGETGRWVELESLYSEVGSRVSKTLEAGYIPVALRYNVELRDKVSSLQFLETYVAYSIRYNSPSRQEVTLGRMKHDELERLFDFLKANQGVFPFPSLGDYEEHHKVVMSRFKFNRRVPKEFRELQGEFLEASRCVNCSLCLDHCLAYSTTGDIEDSPLGKLNRASVGETKFEACFGCWRCQEACPQKIRISAVTEALPRLAPDVTRKVKIEKASPGTSELEVSLEEKFKNRPLFVLFAGCAPQYDPDGVEGFLTFLDREGEVLPNSLSPRVKVVDGSCCGFDSFVQGDLKGAREAVVTIVKRLEELGADGVYFLCPEGLYVYSSLGGKNGHLAVEAMRGFLPEDYHAGCWARKLGLGQGEYRCAGSFLAQYRGANVNPGKEDRPTLCPFSTWKFGTKSVYDLFVSSSSKAKVSPSLDDDLRRLLMSSVEVAVQESGDELAGKVGQLEMGGPAFFKVIAVQIFRKNLSKALASKARESPVVDMLRESPREVEIAVERILDQLRIEVAKGDFPEGLRSRISSSRALDYKYKNTVESQVFLDLLRKVLGDALGEQIVIDALRKAAIS